MVWFCDKRANKIRFSALLYGHRPSRRNWDNRKIPPLGLCTSVRSLYLRVMLRATRRILSLPQVGQILI